MRLVSCTGKTTRTGIEVHRHKIRARSRVEVIEHAAHGGDIPGQTGSDKARLIARTACHSQEIVEVIFLGLDEDVACAPQVGLNAGCNVITYQDESSCRNTQQDDEYQRNNEQGVFLLNVHVRFDPLISGTDPLRPPAWRARCNPPRHRGKPA